VGKELKKGFKGDSHLPGRRAMKALQAIHPHKDSPPAGGFDDRTQLHEGFHHLFLGCVIVGRIRLQKSQGRAEGDSLGEQLFWTNACFGSPFRDLPDSPPGSFSRGEKSYGGGVQLRCTNQLQSKLERR
jgi:hypothetical protein